MLMQYIREEVAADSPLLAVLVEEAIACRNQRSDRSFKVS